MMNNIKSMTGYGKATNSTSERRITVEIKSLNSKQLDLSTRIANLYREQEFTVRTKIAKQLIRGKVDLSISFENIANQNSTTINKDVFQDYYKQICSLNCDMGLAVDYLSAILRMPDVLTTPKMELSEEEAKILEQTVDQAIGNIDLFRLKEGDILMQDILSHLFMIEKYLVDVEQWENERVEAVRTRIKECLEKNNISVDQNRFEQEMIFYMEKLDITEEKVRLQKHIDYFRTECNEKDGVGKKLGFVVQEIGREINTLGSKSNNYNMQQIVVGMKDELEKIKEQLLNIL